MYISTGEPWWSSKYQQWIVEIKAVSNTERERERERMQTCLQRVYHLNRCKNFYFAILSVNMQGDWSRFAYPVQRSYGISVDEWSDQPLVTCIIYRFLRQGAKPRTPTTENLVFTQLSQSEIFFGVVFNLIRMVFYSHGEGLSREPYSDYFLFRGLCLWLGWFACEGIQFPTDHLNDPFLSSVCVCVGGGHSMCIDLEEPARSHVFVYREGPEGIKKNIKTIFVPTENPGRAVALRVWPQRFLSSLDQVRAVPQSRSGKETTNSSTSRQLRKCIKERIAFKIYSKCCA